MIERKQKEVLLDEAAKRAISRFQLELIPDTYRELLGTSDHNNQLYGKPLAPVYIAKDGDDIDLGKMSKFFTGLSRDIKVGRESITSLNNIVDRSEEILFNKLNSINKRSSAIIKQVEAERNRASLGSNWVFSDSFTSTDWIDISRTTAWIDTEVGECFLPLFTNSSVYQNELVVTNRNTSNGINTLGTSPEDALDSTKNGGWKAQFLNNTQSDSVEFTFNRPIDLMDVQLEPTGFSTQVKLEIDCGNGKGFSSILSEILYKKTTFVINSSNVIKVRLTISSVNSPAVAGIKNLVFFKQGTASSASIYTTPIGINVTYSKIQLSLDSILPDQTFIKSFYSTDNSNWNRIDKDIWVDLTTSTYQSVILDNNSTYVNNGLYYNNVTNSSLNNSEGKLVVGLNQVEVSAVRKDYVVKGELPHVPSPEDFESNNVFKTWLNVGVAHEKDSYGTHLYVTPNTGQGTGIVRGSNTLPFQYQVDELPYYDLGFILLNGPIGTRISQPNYTYKTAFKVYVEKDIVVDFCKYFFYQGTRVRTARSFKDINRSYGAFKLVVNNNVVASTYKPYTVYSTALNGSYVEGGIEGAGEQGTSFNMPLVKGWNTVEIYTHTIDPYIYGIDDAIPNDSYPYLQLSLYPSLFDPRIQALIGITRIVATGEFYPVDKFDLQWNCPPSYNFWSWDSSNVVLNTWGTTPIDGFLEGVIPTFQVNYPSVPGTSASSTLYLRFDEGREANANSTPRLKGYTLHAK